MLRTSPSPRAGFSLIEILIALAIMSVLVAMALPTFQNSVDDATETALVQQLQRVRTAVDFYAFQHDRELPGLAPDSGTWSADTLQDQLTLASNFDGDTAAAGTTGFPYGPYLSDGLPENPVNGLNTILLIGPGGSFTNPDDSTGWVYWADSGDFRANCSGTTADGDPWFEL